MAELSLFDSVSKTIRDRKTEKVMCDIESHRPVPESIQNQNHPLVMSAIETAGWAPFHYPRGIDSMAEPWRAHVLWHDAAFKAAVHMRDTLNVTSKEPRLAAGCSALIIVTWLPEFHELTDQASSKLDREEQIKRDEEHLAAASAMVQNLMLLLTAQGMGTYWSSGGKFRGAEMFDYLSIPRSERFLAGIFVEYPEMMDDQKERKAGAHRNKRCENWIRVVAIDQ